jgi:hypothetical protein
MFYIMQSRTTAITWSYLKTSVFILLLNFLSFCFPSSYALLSTFISVFHYDVSTKAVHYQTKKWLVVG